MRTEAWRRKQLHAQLGSWAELCHDARILYVKQSYTSHVEVRIPGGLCRALSQVLARLGTLAERAAAGLREVQAEYRRAGLPAAESRQFENCSRQAGTFWREFARTMDSLARLARKELAAEPFTAR